MIIFDAAPEPLDELGERAPGRHAKDVSVAVTLGALDRDFTIRRLQSITLARAVGELTRPKLVRLFRFAGCGLDHDQRIGMRLAELGLVFQKPFTPV